jgi:hypothetical protein
LAAALAAALAALAAALDALTAALAAALSLTAALRLLMIQGQLEQELHMNTSSIQQQTCLQ